VLETGLSINPIINLDLSDLELRAGRVRADNGLGNAWYSIENTVQYLQKYLSISRPELTQSSNEEALFVSQMGGRITRQGVWQVIQGWGKEAKISISLSPRILRHTAVIQMMKSGKTVEEIQKLLGHTNVFSTRALIRKLEKSHSHELKMEVS
jgi:integrase/recombinase XerD